MTAAKTQAETESVSAEEFCACFMDQGTIDPEWLVEFWGMEINDKKHFPELVYQPDKVKWPRCTYDLQRDEILLAGVTYKLGPNKLFYSYNGSYMDRGRFFAWMWSGGHLPKGWTV